MAATRAPPGKVQIGKTEEEKEEDYFCPGEADEMVDQDTQMGHWAAVTTQNALVWRHLKLSAERNLFITHLESWQRFVF